MNIKNKLIPFIATALLSSSFSVNATAVRDDIPSCYPMIAKYIDQPVAEPKRSLTVIIDQTIPLPVDIQRDVGAKVMRYLQPGDKINIISFSAFFDDQYTNLTFSGTLDPVLGDDRSSIGKRTLKKFDMCNKKQAVYVKQTIPKKLASAFKGNRDTFPNTELVGTLFDIGNSVVANDSAQERVLLIVSDMIENSSTVTFYSGGMQEPIPHQKHFDTFKNKGLIPNLEGVKVYVIGAGTLPPGGRYRSQDYMNSLKKFWKLWVEASGARLEGWGQPALMQDLR